MNNIKVFLVFALVFSVFLAGSVVACWQHTTSSTCDANSSCTWKSDSWGGWCETLGCWSFWNQTDCDTITVSGKNCSWQGGSTYYSCEELGCWSFDGTTADSCVNNSNGLSCEWHDECSGWNSAGIDCWSLVTEAECRNITGCDWGSCWTKSCWSYNTSAECRAGRDASRQNCTWDSSGYCTENGCWRYYTEAECINATNSAGRHCYWSGEWDSCYDVTCSYMDYTNESYCEDDNTYNLTCEWTESWCMQKSCWSAFTQAACGAQSGCRWTPYTSGGYCEEVQCWNWDSWKGGSSGACTGNATLYGLNCQWQDGPGGTGWCFQKFDMLNCTNFTTERQCNDHWCWWEFYDWNTPESGGFCKDPEWGTGDFSDADFFMEFNPGCEIFDNNLTKCDLILGCDNSTTAGRCIINATHPYADGINLNGLNCSTINDSSLCSSIPMLSTCCSWNSTVCEINKLTTSCWDQMEQLPVGASYCEDYDAYTDYALCIQIAGDPWYMPCKWNNASERCEFKADDIFGNSTQSLTKLDNQKVCEAAGGKWIKENYCEGNRSVPSGRCEYKFDDASTCDKACFACESYDSVGNVVNSSNAQSACEDSKLGYCEFIVNTNAPNGIGFCNAKEQFRTGVVTDCDSNCGDCTYLGNPLSNSSGDCVSGCKTPGCFCDCSNANSVGGGCQWIRDNSTITGGYCIDEGVKTCKDACDRCYTQSDCANKGRSAISNVSGSCKWEEGYSSCVNNVGEETEICWNGNDDNDNGLVDCADPSCYSDAYCGFVEGNCFGWTNNDTCYAAGCEWVLDDWGQWCDFNGSQCWRYDWSETTCNAESNCLWHNGTGSSWCEMNWTITAGCMSLNRSACVAAGGSCTWTNDSWCQQEGSSSDWCTVGDLGGWCDHSSFASQDCWIYQSGSAECNNVSGCNWHIDEYSMPYCETNWSGNCWNYTTSTDCAAGGCWWNSNWNSCTIFMDQCWSYPASSSITSCEAVEDSSGNRLCFWDTWGQYCQSMCFNSSGVQASCLNLAPYCSWRQENGWCEEQHFDACSNSTLYNDQTECEKVTGCRWKSSGWCDPNGLGFSTGAVAGGGGMGGAVGGECYKYDGNETLCTNKSLINISCGWSSEMYPWCEVDWSADCWQYYDVGNCTDTVTGAGATCWWYNATQYDMGDSEFCVNIVEECWMNLTLNDTNACDNSSYCNASSWGGCEPTCFRDDITDADDCIGQTGCRWASGWCSPSGMHDMYDEMQAGSQAPLGMDNCSEVSLARSVDICGFGMKDMGDSYGFGTSVSDFGNTSICNKEKLQNGNIGAGNETIKYFVYLDVDGNTSGGCALSHNATTSEGYEFRFRYTSIWNASKGKPSETFTAYKCHNTDWQVTDIKLSVWKKKMCSDIGGPMIAVEKADLERFPTLYDSTKDMRVYVAIAGENNNATVPSDTAGPGWTTPGAIDFEINSAFEYGANVAKFEQVLRKGYVPFEDCYNSVDDDGDNDVDCDDWDCQYSVYCTENALGVAVANYSDTRAPQVTGVKIEEYNDAALIMYDTNKPTNGTLLFYYNDSECLTLNATIYDVGILKNNTVREFKLWHHGYIFNDSGSTSLDTNLTNQTTYYYKIRVCDSNHKCALSRCSSFITTSSDRCPYCNFVTRIKAPSGWEVYYDLDLDGVYEHWQGHVCGPKSGMRTNYTSGRKANVKMNNSDESAYFEFLNVTLTKSALNDKVRTINNASALIYSENEGHVGMTSETRDKIINNLHPEVCKIKIPFTGTCNSLYQCDDNGQNCIDRTSSADLSDSINCVWQIPYCEFSTYDSDGNPSAETTTVAGTTDGGAGEVAIWAKTTILTAEQFTEGFTKEIGELERLKFEIDGESHHVGVKSLTATTATIEVKSEAQEAVLSIGEEKKFEVTDDNYYDVDVRLNSIADNKASITIKSIYEEVPEEEKTVGEAIKETIEKGKEAVKTPVGIAVVIGIVVVVIVVIIYFLKKRRK